MRLFDNRIWGIAAWPVSLLYALGIRVRNLLYDRGVFKPVHLNARVISVGNVTVGGTGKSPLVMAVAQELADGRRIPAIISRGYGRKSKGIVVVSDGETILEDAAASGDEPLLMARTLRGIPVIVGKKRSDAGRRAIADFGCDILVFDDAFQHRSVFRDLDIVVVDARRLWGNGKLLPAGPLREPRAALKRASVVVMTHAGGAEDRQKAGREMLKYTDAPLLFSVHRPVEWVSLQDGTRQAPRSMEGKRVFAFSGIGNPDAFRRTLENEAVDVADFLEFRDHHDYRPGDIDRICRRAQACGAEAVVTTEKDAVRLPSLGKPLAPSYYLRIRFECLGGMDALMQTVVPPVDSAEEK